MGRGDMNLPKYVRYKGLRWHVVRKGDHQVTLCIIGFNNWHTLTWGIKTLEMAIKDGTMEVES